MTMASTSADFITGDWVRLSRAPSGYADQVRRTFAAKITLRGLDFSEVALYDRRGGLLASGLRVRYNNLTKIDAPTWETATGSIPITPEVAALKEALYEHAMTVGRRTGMCGVLNEALNELGVHKPEPGKVKATISFEVELDTDKVMSYTTWKSFAAAFDALSTADKVRHLIHRSSYDGAKVEYTVIPPPGHEAPVVEPTPTPETPTAETTPPTVTPGFARTLEDLHQ